MKKELVRGSQMLGFLNSFLVFLDIPLFFKLTDLFIKL